MAKTWLVVMKTEVIHSVFVDASSGAKAQQKVETALEKDSRDPLNQAIMDSIEYADELNETYIEGVEPAVKGRPLTGVEWKAEWRRAQRRKR